METILLMTNQERIAEIEEEIRGVKAQFGITKFELNVLESLKKLKFGSTKQNHILAQIEKKVFGHSRELEPTKKRPY